MSRRHASVDSDAGLLDVEEIPRPEIVLEGEGRDPGPFPPGTFRKIGSGFATLLLLVAATYLVPSLHWARPWTSDDPAIFWNIVGREILGDGERAEAAAQEVARAEEVARKVAVEEDDTPIEDRPVITAPIVDAGAALPAYQPHPDDAENVPRPLEMDDPAVLDAFFEQLALTDAGYEGEITRVSQWGDSVIANDNVTVTLRAKMQRRFGDAGHGFHLLARPNASYRHRGIRFSDGKAWSRCYIINKCKSDGYYGLGGTTVWSAGGAQSVFRTATKTPFGQKASHFELWYARHSRGGNIRIVVDDREPVVVESRRDDTPESEGDDGLVDAWERIEMGDGAHAIEVRAAGGGLVRAYGVVMERDGPGVVWDGMAQLGAFASRMLHFDPEHLRGQIEHRDPDLLVFMFGGNDLLLGARRLEEYAQTYTAVLRLFRDEDAPRACLVVSPVDHGIREAGRIRSNPMVAKLTQVQRKVALAEGCAFFDTLSAMGGEGSVARWRRARPPLISGDLAHLTNAGQKVLGHYVYLALMQAYRAYRARTDGPASAP